MISFNEFQAKAKLGQLIPVSKKLIADMETPLSVLAKFQHEPQIFLLESVVPGETNGRYSFIGRHPHGHFQIKGNTPFLNGEKLPFETAPIHALENILNTQKLVEDDTLPPLIGGAMGYIAYENVYTFEKVPHAQVNENEITAQFFLTHELIVFDNMLHTLYLIVLADTTAFPNLKAVYADAVEKLEAMEKQLAITAPSICNEGILGEFSSNMTRDQYKKNVEIAKHHIKEGDIFQVVLSRQFSAECTLEPIQIYRALRMINPSPYTFFLKMDNEYLIGASPETHVKSNQSQITLRPIAGTRKRHADVEKDQQLAAELLNDVKERAEHLMLVDLGRNDLGSVAMSGSVQVDEYACIERYSHVMHLVSTIHAELAPQYHRPDLIRATFPAGTLSGAPKVRAMEIIHELEPTSRGAYGGAIGYLSYNGNMDLAITIRTIHLKNQRAEIQAGAGIVYDSDPEFEAQEVENKSQAMFNALKFAANQLNMEV